MKIFKITEHNKKDNTTARYLAGKGTETRVIENNFSLNKVGIPITLIDKSKAKNLSLFDIRFVGVPV